MTEQLIQLITHLIEVYGLAGLFFAAALEEMVTVLPSMFIIMAGGFFLLGGEPISLVSLSVFFFQVVLPVSLGLTLGSLVLYGLCWKIGRSFIDRYGKYLLLSWESIETYQRKMDGRALDRRVLLFLRIVPIMPSISVNAFCGLVKWPFWSYLSITLLGSMLRAIWLGALGWQLGTLYQEYAESFGRIQGYFFLVILLCALVAIVFFYFRKKSLSTV
jgi:membrane protein DedA with SNARE-associated domain